MIIKHLLLTIYYSLFRASSARPFTTPRAQRAAGQVIVEYAIVFPLQLMLTLAVIQLAHIFIAKQILEYGAYCAARSALVADTSTAALEREALWEARLAAAIPISRIAGDSGFQNSDELITIPGWGLLPNSTAAWE